MTIDGGDACSFARHFETLTGNKPFGWQKRLFDRFAAGDLPSAVDLPTGLGKTSVMAIWLIARARQPKLPRRLVYVVDRRVVVDQATAEAEKLKFALKEIDARSLAEALRATDGDGLPISTLRGQHVDNRLWLQEPSRPAIIIGTIDMIGSRLLFEGYGVSRRMRPYQAGLLGVDTLVILDEAHLCPPFERLLTAIADPDRGDFLPREVTRRAIVPKFLLLPLSATNRDDGTEMTNAFRLEEADYDSLTQPIVRQRYAATKRLALLDIEKSKLVKTLVDRAIELGRENGRILVFCNGHDNARKVEEALRKGVEDTGRIELIVGRRRVRERSDLADHLTALGFLGDHRDQSGPAFVIATSAGEVGIDLDADHMVCDLVPFERMVQRLGRVNRRGGEGRAATVDVCCIPPEDAKGQDAERLDATRALLKLLPLSADSRRDASPRALADLKAVHGEAIEKASTKAPLYPRLDRAVVDAWSMTSLKEHAGRPEPQPWLRGWVEEEPQTTVLWRRWLPWRAADHNPEREAVESFFDAARPYANEMLEAPTSEVVDVLITRAKRRIEQAKYGNAGQSTVSATKDGVIALTVAREFKASWTVAELAAIGDKASRTKKELEHALAYSMVIASASLGGLNDKGLLDAAAADAPACLDDGWDEVEREQAGVRVRGPAESLELQSEWRETYRFPLADAEDDEPAAIAVDVLRSKGATLAGDLAIAQRAQKLAEHGGWAREEAQNLASALGLDPAHAKMLAVAAEAHDLGKSRDLWQNAMRAPRDGRPYAKTKGGGDPSLLKIGEHTYRHEFGSLRDVERDANAPVNELSDDLRDLALHLIAAHHGFARPVIAPVDPLSPPELSQRRAAEAALRFARLQRQWGPWGLAWWEALLRAADQRASARLDAAEEAKAPCAAGEPIAAGVG